MGTTLITLLFLASVYVLYYIIKQYKDIKFLTNVNKTLNESCKAFADLNSQLIKQCTDLKAVNDYYKVQFDEISKKLSNHAIHLSGINDGIVNNNIKYNVDEILDEINKNGIGNIDKDKINFLKNNK